MNLNRFPQQGICKPSKTPPNIRDMGGYGNGKGRYTPQPQHRATRFDIEAPRPPPPPPTSIPPPLPPPNPDCEMKELNKMFGMTASDIDKYSRIFFPVTFTCFQLMYWIIYQHLSDEEIDDLVYLEKE